MRANFMPLRKVANVQMRVHTNEQNAEQMPSIVS